MHEKRNFFMVILLLASIIWGTWAWFFLEGTMHDTFAIVHRSMSLLLIASLSIWLFYTLRFEDKLPDHMRNVVGPIYYEVDGLSVLPMIRQNGKQVELCIYYQNRFENPAECIVHLRPPAENSFIIQPGYRDVHFAFKCDGGDFGVLRQPVAVPRQVQGDVVEVLMGPPAAGTRAAMATDGARALACPAERCRWTGRAIRSRSACMSRPATFR